MALEWKNTCEIKYLSAEAGDVMYFIEFNSERSCKVECRVTSGEMGLDQLIHANDGDAIDGVESAKAWAQNHYEKTFKGKI